MALSQRIPRNLENPARICGLNPTELAACALFYAVFSAASRGVPFSGLISIALAVVLGVGMVILNRTYPPYQGLFLALRLLRPALVPVMPFGMRGERKEPIEHNRSKT